MKGCYEHTKHLPIPLKLNQIWFLISEVAELTGVSVSTLARWDQAGMLKPSAGRREWRGRERRYSAADVFVAAVARDLRGQGAPLKRTKEALAELTHTTRRRDCLPRNLFWEAMHGIPVALEIRPGWTLSWYAREAIDLIASKGSKPDVWILDLNALAAATVPAMVDMWLKSVAEIRTHFSVPTRKQQARNHKIRTVVDLIRRKGRVVKGHTLDNTRYF